MSTYSKRIRIHPNILLEYIFDESNMKSEYYEVLTNLKENTKSFLSSVGNNTQNNNLFLVDPVLSKYSIVDTINFNFLKLQNFFTPAIKYDKIKIYLSGGFDFYDYLGFYINIYTHGFNNNKKYSLTNFHFLKSNTNAINIFDLNIPFYYDEKFWVRYIELEFPSVNDVSSDRNITNNINEPTLDSLNKNLTYGEGLSTNSPIFIDFSFITHNQTLFNIPYYFIGDEYSVSLAQTPEYTEVGINISESTQGDFFEIYATYLGSNENMDEFTYNEMIKGDKIRLDYIINLYEENILTTTETRTVVENFTQKLLYRPVIQFSNTTATIDVELRIVSLIDSGYISKFASLGIVDNINKYGLRLTRLNMNEGVINPFIYNLKVNNTMSVTGGIVDNIMDVMKIPYPILIDKYKILIKSANTSNTNGYIPNGLLEVLINPFDNIIEFNIAQDINSDGNIIPYDISNISVNSNLLLVFRSDSEKLEIEPFYEANNNYENGRIFYKVSEKNYNVLRRIYDKGYDNFYLVVSSQNSNTQLYSGKFILYEDVTFISDEITETETETGTGTSSDLTSTENIDDVKIDNMIKINNPFLDNKLIMTDLSDKNYFNVIVYVRFHQNIQKMKTYCKLNGIIPKIEYGNLFYFEKIYIRRVDDFKRQEFIEMVFQLEIGKPPIEEKEIYAKPVVEVIRKPEVSPVIPPKKEEIIPSPTIVVNNNNTNTDYVPSGRGGGGGRGDYITPQQLM